MGATDVPQAQAVTVSLQELVDGELINGILQRNLPFQRNEIRS